MKGIQIPAHAVTKWWWLPALMALMATTGEAWPCAVCGTAIEASKFAFMYSTAALSLIPLAMIGGLIYYLFRLSHKKPKQSDSENQVT